MKDQLTIFDDPNEAFNQQKSFHNTTGFKGNILKQAEKHCKTQEVEIYNYFKAVTKKKPGTILTPSMIWKILFQHTGTPITSIRRGITNLTEKGLLEKTERQKPGIYGKPEHYWKLK